MFAHRVGTLGAILAVLILSVELLGAIAWKHHAVARAHGPDSTLVRGS